MPPDASSGGDGGGGDAVRFLDILTTASSVAHARGAEAVGAAHLLEAVAVLTGEAEPEEGGGPVSPLGRGRRELAAEPAVRALTQRWFARLGGAPEATLTPEELAELRAEAGALVRS